MKIAYLLFAYNNPQLIGKLIDTLSHDDSAFFVHLDSKSDFARFAHLQKPNVIFAPQRIAVYWAEYSGVLAILLLMRQAIAHRAYFDYCVLLSGSEYPLRHREYIHDFLEANHGTEFITMVKMPNEAAGKPISRINSLRIQSNRPFLRLLVKILARFGLARRNYVKHLGGLEPYAGNTWWALTREACDYILSFVDSSPNVGDYFKNTFAPEEMFFHTILGNSPFRGRIRRNLVFEDWSQKGGHPAMITQKHISLFAAHDKVEPRDLHGPGELLFARKFSDSDEGAIMEMDAMIAEKRRRT